MEIRSQLWTIFRNLFDSIQKKQTKNRCVAVVVSFRLTDHLNAVHSQHQLGWLLMSTHCCCCCCVPWSLARCEISMQIHDQWFATKFQIYILLPKQFLFLQLHLIRRTNAIMTHIFLVVCWIVEWHSSWSQHFNIYCHLLSENQVSNGQNSHL